MSNNDCYPKFIDSLPVGEDRFLGKSQENLAESLSTLIQTDRTAAKLIGLEGVWGSGKSNLVRIIARKLEDSHHVFIYDAWGHQEDLQRRAFLEELTEKLIDNNLIGGAKWQEKLNNLLSRKKEKITKTVPKFSKAIIATALISIFTPIAHSISDVFVGRPITQLLVTMTPLFIGLASWFIASILRGRYIGIEELYFVYKDSELSNVVHTTISENNPSVREFQQWMRELSASLGKKLVIVFDNMDRLPSDRVRDLWSSIHTFFVEETFENIWVIVPFDREQIELVFGGNRKTSEQFMRKSFTVIYRMAPPVLTDWQLFFDEKMNQAFGDEDAHLMKSIRRCFDLYNSDITPRNIISFVNELVSLKIIRGSEIRLDYIAIYILAKNEILRNPTDQILSKQFLGNLEPLYRGDSALQNAIAALAYQVPMESASQVTLSRQIKTALNDKRRARLIELQQHIHFIDILEEVVNDEDIEVESAVFTFEGLVDSADWSDEYKESFANIWIELARKRQEIPVTVQQILEMDEILLRRLDGDSCQSIVKALVVGFRNVEKFEGGKYFGSLNRLEAIINENKIAIELSDYTDVIEKPAEIFIDYIIAAKRNYKRYKLTYNEQDLLNHIANAVPKQLQDFYQLAVLKDEINFEPVLNALEDSIDEDEIISKNLPDFYRFYKSIATDRPLKLVRDELVVDYFAGQENIEDADIEMMAFVLSRGSSFGGHTPDTLELIESNSDKLSSKIAKTIENYNLLGNMILDYLKSESAMLKKVLRLLILHSHHGVSKLNIKTILPRFTDICESLNIEARDLSKRLNGWNSYLVEALDTLDLKELIVDPSYYALNAGVNTNLHNNILKALNEKMESFSVSEWRTFQIQTSSYYAESLKHLLASRTIMEPPENAVIAFKEILMLFAKDELPDGTPTDWDIFYERTHKNKLKATAKNIRDLYINDRNITVAQFRKLSSLLLDHGSLDQRSEDVVRKIFTPVAFDSDAMKILIARSETTVDLVRKAASDASDFIEILSQFVQEDNVSDELLEFAAQLGFPREGSDNEIDQMDQEGH